MLLRSPAEDKQKRAAWAAASLGRCPIPPATARTATARALTRRTKTATRRTKQIRAMTQKTLRKTMARTRRFRWACVVLFTGTLETCSWSGFVLERVRRFSGLCVASLSGAVRSRRGSRRRLSCHCEATWHAVFSNVLLLVLPLSGWHRKRPRVKIRPPRRPATAASPRRCAHAAPNHSALPPWATRTNSTSASSTPLGQRPGRAPPLRPQRRPWPPLGCRGPRHPRLTHSHLSQSQSAPPPSLPLSLSARPPLRFPSRLWPKHPPCLRPLAPNTKSRPRRLRVTRRELMAWPTDGAYF